MDPWGLAGKFCTSKRGSAAFLLPSPLFVCSFVMGPAEAVSILWAVVLTIFIPWMPFTGLANKAGPMRSYRIWLSDGTKNRSIGFVNTGVQRKYSVSPLHCKVTLTRNWNLCGRRCKCPNNRKSSFVSMWQEHKPGSSSAGSSECSGPPAHRVTWVLISLYV